MMMLNSPFPGTSNTPGGGPKQMQRKELPAVRPGQVRVLTEPTRTPEGCMVASGATVRIVRRMAGPWWQVEGGNGETALLPEEALLKARLLAR